MDFVIVSDSSCNLPDDIIDEFGIHILPLTFMSDGEQFTSYSAGEKSDLQRFYKMMREGKVFTTSLPNQEKTIEHLVELLEGGNDILYIGFSSGLSGTAPATASIIEELRAQYPERKMMHIDTLAASMGEGLLVYKAACMARDGATMEETHAWVRDNMHNLAHWFTVDDLMYLFRGGRVSRTSAWAGSLLHIKPVLHVDDEGHLIPMEKIRGRKKAIQRLFKHMKESALQPVSEQTVFISHGDCLEDAEYLADMIRTELGVTDIRFNFVDPVIGAHSGPGTLALFFMADKR